MNIASDAFDQTVLPFQMKNPVVTSVDPPQHRTTLTRDFPLGRDSEQREQFADHKPLAYQGWEDKL